MTNANDVRRAHEILADISIGNQPNEGNLNHLRSFLPELPKQKTLEELHREVYDVWAGTNGNEWPDDVHGGLETWLLELHRQLKGFKDAPVSSSSLPAGMRLADHEKYGRVVVSPKVDPGGVCEILCIDSRPDVGSRFEWVHKCELTFIDAEPVHPEFLETEADYENAPEWTIVAWDDSIPWYKRDSSWQSVMAYGHQNVKGMSCVCRRVLRWGSANEQL